MDTKNGRFFSDKMAMTVGENVLRPIEDRYAAGEFISIYDVYEILGIRANARNADDTHYLLNNGWTKKNPELHEASKQELYPDGCPFCGRPW